MLALGAAVIASSIFYNSSILAFIGLALAFWGALLLYLQDRDYTRKSLLDTSVLPSLAILNQMIEELDYQGTAVYLPPKYFEDPEATKILIPKRNTALPTSEQIQKGEKQLFIKTPQALLLTSPGLELSRLFEKAFETSLTQVDIPYLQQNMPKIFVEDLEIAENLEIEMLSNQVATKITDSISHIQTKNDTIRVRLVNTIYNEIHRQTSQLPRVHRGIGCPICSSIACALAKASGRPVILEKTETTKDGKTIEATYKILGE
jgi:hypothetical protein